MVRTVVSFVVAGGLSLLALILGPVLEKIAPPPPVPPPVVKPDPVPPVPPPVPTAEPTLPHRASAGHPVRIEGALDGSHLLVDGDGTVYLVADVTASDEAAPGRRPLDLALVIDRSGSMAGPKLRAAKAAATDLVQRLRPDDRVTLITYGSTVSLLAQQVRGDASGKARLLAAVEGIEDFGGTFISGALEAAHRSLRTGRAGAVKRVLFLSDGEANEGITSPAGLRRLAGKLAASGISISSIGVGTDFNEDVMLALADRSGGRYTYLRGPRGLSEVLAGELMSAAATVAQEVQVTVDPLGGATVNTVYGYPSVTRGGAATVRLADLGAGETRRVVVRLQAPAHSVGAFPVARVHLSYLRPDDGFPMSETLTLGHAVTASLSQVDGGRDLAAAAAAARAEAAEGLEAATRLYEAGRTRDAQKVMKTRLEQVILKNHKYIRNDDLNVELREMESSIDFSGTSVNSEAGRDLVKSNKARALRMAR